MAFENPIPAQLGFRQTVRADHTRGNAAGELVSAGSSQRSVMFHNGYIEFMPITDRLAGHQLTPAIDVRYGLHVVALATSDATACRVSLEGAGVHVGPLLNWSRQIHEADCRGEARFRYFDSDWDAHDPSYICWVQHLTPELLRPRQLLNHENRAMALTQVHYRGPQARAQAWAAQLLRSGAQASHERANGVDVSFPNARFCIEFDLTLPTLLPSALVLAFTDTDWLRQRCRELGLAVQDLADGAFDLDLERPLGLHLVCVPAAPAAVGAGA